MVSALDYETGRVTTFRVPSLEVGRVISGISGGGFHHVWVGDTIWIVRPNPHGPTSPLATAHLASSGAQIDAAPVADPEDQPFGGAFDLAATATRLVTSTTRPGVWWERRAGDWRRVGEPLFPDAPPEKRIEVAPRSFQIIPSPASASSIAVINDSLVVQAFIRQEGVQEAENPRGVPREAFLGVFSVDGTHLQTLPIETVPGCLNSAGEFQLLVCTVGAVPPGKTLPIGGVRTPPNPTWPHLALAKQFPYFFGYTSGFPIFLGHPWILATLPALPRGSSSPPPTGFSPSYRILYLGGSAYPRPP